MTGTPLLDEQALDHYRSLLLEVGIPFDQWTNPGLSDSQMDNVAASLPFDLPSEARTWWAWRDGASESKAASFGPGYYCFSLSGAVEAYGQARATARKSAGEPGLEGPRSDPDFLWKPSWLPILGPGALKTAIDCDVAEGEPSPVSFIDVAEQPEEYARHKARSMGELIGWWCCALEVGAWEWDASQFKWEVYFDRLPEDLQNPLV